MNAIKSENGEWKEMGSGASINFHHFPAFNPSYGKPGNTLLWDAFENRLIIADANEQRPALCFHEHEKSMVFCLQKMRYSKLIQRFLIEKGNFLGNRANRGKEKSYRNS